MRSPWTHILLSLASLAFGACQGLEEGNTLMGTTAQAIVNGSEALNDDQVVALTYNGSQFCSGTLVAKRTIVTAAHCLPPNVDIPMSSIRVYFGSSTNGEGMSLPIADAIAHPNWNVNRLGDDVGVIALGEDAPFEPMPMAYHDVSAVGALGQEVRAVGYGVTGTDEDGNGVRRTGMLRVNRYDESSLFLSPGPSATCNGDSGGALYAIQDGQEVLAGIHSRSDCGDAIIAERVDVHAMNFITPFIEEHEGSASCESDGKCSADCEGMDPDCPCVEDGACSEMCSTPQSDLDCAARSCPTDGVCDESCGYDFDCQAPICADGNCEDLQDSGGCSAASASGRAGFGAGLFLMLLGALRRRRLN